jgi:hypothetical protein
MIGNQPPSLAWETAEILEPQKVWGAMGEFGLHDTHKPCHTQRKTSWPMFMTWNCDSQRILGPQQNQHHLET